MTTKLRDRLTFANAMSVTAVFIALGGTAWAVVNVGPRDIRDEAVHSRHIHNGAVRGEQLHSDAVTSSKVLDGSLLGADFAAGEGSPGDLLPAGAVSFFDLASCPSGWSELTAARGRYLVGLPSGGTLSGTAGTALTNLENRPVGQHDHGITDPGHTHPIAADTGGTPSSLASTSHGAVGWDGTAAKPTLSSTTGITVNNAGAVPGTNAPYLQLLACKKS